MMMPHRMGQQRMMNNPQVMVPHKEVVSRGAASKVKGSGGGNNNQYKNDQQPRHQIMMSRQQHMMMMNGREVMMNQKQLKSPSFNKDESKVIHQPPTSKYTKSAQQQLAQKIPPEKRQFLRNQNQIKKEIIKREGGQKILPPLPRSHSFHQILKPTENGQMLASKGTIKGISGGKLMTFAFGGSQLNVNFSQSQSSGLDKLNRETNDENEAMNMIKKMKRRSEAIPNTSLPPDNEEEDSNNINDPELIEILKYRRCKSETDLLKDDDDQNDDDDEDDDDSGRRDEDKANGATGSNSNSNQNNTNIITGNNGKIMNGLQSSSSIHNHDSSTPSPVSSSSSSAAARIQQKAKYRAPPPPGSGIINAQLTNGTTVAKIPTDQAMINHHPSVVTGNNIRLRENQHKSSPSSSHPDMTDHNNGNKITNGGKSAPSYISSSSSNNNPINGNNKKKLNGNEEEDDHRHHLHPHLPHPASNHEKMGKNSTKVGDDGIPRHPLVTSSSSHHPSHQENPLESNISSSSSSSSFELIMNKSKLVHAQTTTQNYDDHAIRMNHPHDGSGGSSSKVITNNINGNLKVEQSAASPSAASSGSSSGVSSMIPRLLKSVKQQQPQSTGSTVIHAYSDDHHNDQNSNDVHSRQKHQPAVVGDGTDAGATKVSSHLHSNQHHHHHLHQHNHPIRVHHEMNGHNNKGAVGRGTVGEERISSAGFGGDSNISAESRNLIFDSNRVIQHKMMMLKNAQMKQQNGRQEQNNYNNNQRTQNNQNSNHQNEKMVGGGGKKIMNNDKSNPPQPDIIKSGHEQKQQHHQQNQPAVNHNQFLNGCHQVIDGQNGPNGESSSGQKQQNQKYFYLSSEKDQKDFLDKLEASFLHQKMSHDSKNKQTTPMSGANGNNGYSSYHHHHLHDTTDQDFRVKNHHPADDHPASSDDDNDADHDNLNQVKRRNLPPPAAAATAFARSHDHPNGPLNDNHHQVYPENQHQHPIDTSAPVGKSKQQILHPLQPTSGVSNNVTKMNKMMMGMGMMMVRNKKLMKQHPPHLLHHLPHQPSSQQEILSHLKKTMSSFTDCLEVAEFVQQQKQHQATTQSPHVQKQYPPNLYDPPGDGNDDHRRLPDNDHDEDPNGYSFGTEVAPGPVDDSKSDTESARINYRMIHPSFDDNFILKRPETDKSHNHGARKGLHQDNHAGPGKNLNNGSDMRMRMNQVMMMQSRVSDSNKMNQKIMIKKGAKPFSKLIHAGSSSADDHRRRHYPNPLIKKSSSPTSSSSSLSSPQRFSPQDDDQSGDSCSRRIREHKGTQTLQQSQDVRSTSCSPLEKQSYIVANHPDIRSPTNGNHEPEVVPLSKFPPSIIRWLTEKTPNPAYYDMMMVDGDEDDDDGFEDIV